MKLLWVTPKWTLPASDGARVASRQLIKSLVAEGVEIHYLALSHPEDKEIEEVLIEDLGVTTAHFIKRNLPSSLLEKIFFYGLSFLFTPSKPLTVASFSSSHIKKFCLKRFESNQYDFVVADGLHSIVPLLSLDAKLIYRSHNVEFEIWKKASQDARFLIKKIFLLTQYFAMKSFERKVIHYVDYVFPISDEDRLTYKEYLKEDSKLMTLPLGLTFKKIQLTKNVNKIRLLFLGRLDWPPNRDGLIWFLKEVWPQLSPKKFQLIIVGSGDSEWVKAYSECEGVIFHGFVENLDSIYENIDVSLIPIFYGSGTRIKVIEAVSRRIPIVSTRMGAQGSSLLPNEEFSQVETASEWVDTLSKFDLEASRDRANKAFKRLQKELAQENIAQNFLQKLS